MRKLIVGGLWLLLLLVMMTPVSALRDFDVHIDSKGVALIPNQQIMIKMNITNELGEEETFRITIPDVIWTVQSDPLQDYFGGITIDNGETDTVTLLISTKEQLPTGPYQIEYAIEATKQNIKRQGTFFITVRNDRALLRDYLATVPHLVEVPAVINPGEETDIVFNLENKGIKNIAELNITLKSDSIEKVASTSLDALSKKIFTVPVIIPSGTQPGQETLNIFFSVGNKTLEPLLKENYQVGESATIVKLNETVEQGFLRTTYTTVYTNNGNVYGEQVVTYPSSPLGVLFTRANAPNYQENINGETSVAVTVALQSGETTSVQVVEDYLLPVIVLIVIGVGVGLYFFFRNSVRIKKHATVLSFKEGGVSEIKITLQIVNHTTKEFTNIQIKDMLSSLAHLSKEGMGTLKPTDIHHTQRNTQLIWELESLEPQDERVITYKIRTKLAILGGFTLPPVTMHYHDKKHKFVASSKKVNIST